MGADGPGVRLVGPGWACQLRGVVRSQARVGMAAPFRRGVVPGVPRHSREELGARVDFASQQEAPAGRAGMGVYAPVPEDLENRVGQTGSGCPSLASPTPYAL